MLWKLSRKAPRSPPLGSMVHPEEGGVRGRWSGHGRVRDPGARGCEGPAGSAGDALLGVAGRDTDERCVVALRTSGSQTREPGINSRVHGLRPETSQSFKTAAREQKTMVRGKHLSEPPGSRNLPRKSWLESGSRHLRGTHLIASQENQADQQGKTLPLRSAV